MIEVDISRQPYTMSLGAQNSMYGSNSLDLEDFDTLLVCKVIVISTAQDTPELEDELFD